MAKLLPYSEADFDHLRTIANVMKQSGCRVEEWMLQLKPSHYHHHNNNSNQQRRHGLPPRRSNIDTTPRYDKRKRFHKLQMIQESKRKKQRKEQEK
jgi:ATP-dependent RNA helicase DDX52/ROK1